MFAHDLAPVDDDEHENQLERQQDALEYLRVHDELEQRIVRDHDDEQRAEQNRAAEE